MPGLGYFHDPNCVSPKMTANDAPSPWVVSCSDHTGIYDAWAAWKQLGNVSPECWYVNSTIAPQWMKIDAGVGNTLTINAYSITSAYNNSTFPGAPREWTLEGSDDDSAWTTLHTVATIPDTWPNASTTRFFLSAPATYRYYKFTWTLKDSGPAGWQICEIELINTTDTPYSHNDNTVHPAMTGVNTPSPYVVSEGGYTGDYRGWKAFDQQAGEFVVFYWDYDLGTWIKMDLGEGKAKVVNAYTLTSARNNSSYPGMPKSFELEGSNNDSTWVTLDTQTGVPNWRGAEMRTYQFSSGTAYRYYRWSMLAMEDNNEGCQVDEIELIGLPPASTFWPVILRLLGQQGQ